MFIQIEATVARLTSLVDLKTLVYVYVLSSNTAELPNPVGMSLSRLVLSTKPKKMTVNTGFFVRVRNGAVFYNEYGVRGLVYDWRSVMALRNAHNEAESAT